MSLNNDSKSLRIIYISVAIALVVAAVLLYFFDPMQCAWSYKCPIKYIFSIDCPACGGQRAAHAFLHGRFSEAIAYNPFLVIGMMYLFAVCCVSIFKGKYFEKTRRFLTGRLCSGIYISLYFIWWIVRNL